jgi:hypothetical protein
MESINYQEINLEELEQKISNHELITLDELLKLSRIHLIDLFSKDELSLYSHVTWCLFEDFFFGRYDDIVFNDYSMNIEKIKLLVTRFDRNVNNYYGHEDWIEDITDVDFEMNLKFYEGTKSHLILLLNSMNIYCPDYQFDNQLTQEELKELKEESEVEIIDKRISQKAPPNAARIKALKEFCPELWDKLSKSQNKEVQQNVIHLITAVNIEDSYKLSFGSRQSDRENRSIEGLEELKKKLE